MDAKEELKDIADFVVDLLTDPRGPKHQDAQAQQAHVDPNAEHFTTHSDLSQAIDIDAGNGGGPAHDVGTGTNHGPSGLGIHGLTGAQPLSAQTHAAPVHAAPRPVAPQPAPQPVVHEVVRNVVHERVVEKPSVTHVTEQHTNNTFLREGDHVTDNRTINNITANGHDIDIDIDQDIKNNTVNADHGAVAAGGSIKDSAVNTGKFEGVQSAGDVDADHAVVGDGNTVLNESEVGAFSGKGDATNAEGKNVNVGGHQNVVDNDGDGQVAIGDRNDLRGDVDIDVDDVKGNANIAVGDHNDESAKQDNSETTTGSHNTDNSTNDSANTKVDDSFNEEIDIKDTANTTTQSTVTDNDDASQHGSNNSHAATTTTEDLHLTDNDTTVSQQTTEAHELDQHVDVVGDDNDVDTQADHGLFGAQHELDEHHTLDTDLDLDDDDLDD